LQGFKRRRGDSWELTVSDGFDINGKRIRHTRTIKPVFNQQGKLVALSSAEADNELRSFILEIQGVSYAGRMTIAEYLDYWYKTFINPSELPENDKKYSINTKVWYKGNIEKYLKPKIGHILLRELTSHHIQIMMTQIAKEYPLEKESIHGIFRTLRTALESAVGVHINHNPAKDKLARPPIPTKRETMEKHRILSLDEAIVFLYTAKRQWYTAAKRYEFKKMMIYGIFFMALFQAMRQGELLGLKWENVDIENRTIEVREQLLASGKKPRFGDPKTPGSFRTIRMARVVAELLQEIKKYQDIVKEANQEIWENYNLVFTQDDGRPFCGHSITKRHLKNTLNLAGIAEIRFQDLRATTATLLRELGEDTWTIASICGHAAEEVTQDHYIHKNVSHQDRAIAGMEKMFAERIAILKVNPQNFIPGTKNTPSKNKQNLRKKPTVENTFG
jgi:integrase